MLRDMGGLAVSAMVILYLFLLGLVAPNARKATEYRLMYWFAPYALPNEDLDEWEKVATRKDRDRIARDRRTNEERAKRRRANILTEA